MLLITIHSRSYMRSSISQHEMISSHLLIHTPHIPPQGPSLPALCPDLLPISRIIAVASQRLGARTCCATPSLANIEFSSFNTNYASSFTQMQRVHPVHALMPKIRILVTLSLSRKEAGTTPVLFCLQGTHGSPSPSSPPEGPDSRSE